MEPFVVPVLVIGFNRPDRLREVLKRVEPFGVKRLYVAIDGPRNEADEDRVNDTRDVVKERSWAEQSITRFRDHNLGCRRGVIDAVTWALEKEPAVIVIEDDALPEPSFFGYAIELLERYKFESSVLAITGESKVPLALTPRDTSYRFSKMGPAGAWATWHDRWSSFIKTRDIDFPHVLWKIGKSPSLTAAQKLYWSALMLANETRAMDSWAYPYMLHGLLDGRLTATPNCNLIEDTGIGPEARHMREADVLAQPVAPIEMPLRHPASVTIDELAELWSDEHEFNTTPRGLVRSSNRFVRRWCHLPTPKPRN